MNYHSLQLAAVGASGLVAGAGLWGSTVANWTLRHFSQLGQTELLTTLIPHWWQMGSLLMAPLSLGNILLQAWGAYSSPAEDKNKWYLQLGLAFSSVPWTFLVMGPTIKRLLAGKATVDGYNLDQLLSSFFFLHHFRTVSWLVEFAVGLSGLQAEAFD